MEGATLASKRQLDMLLFGAWHSAMFERQEKLKPLSTYLAAGDKQGHSEDYQNARFIHFFNSLKAKGVPIEVTRIPRNEIN